jgi:phosphoserine phosphatase
VLAEPGDGRPVAFDADGTLWRGDVGEDLLRYLITEGRLPRYRGRTGLYEEYERRVAQDPASGYAFTVEVMEDVEEGALSALCQEFFQRRFAGRLFPFTRPLVQALSGQGYAVWIVSASPTWPVVAGAAALGVPRERVIGVHCDLEAGRLTRRVHTPVPCGEGKVALLRSRGLRPVLGVGNGDLDLQMLAYAERALVIAPHGQDNALVRAALERRWPVQRG